ncbi:DNA polymerase III, tau subunit [Carnobacterium iners]|uniref:DNA-directed DNA polymerase n=1 Tax=Carnobacterium iners TaxID=1073423 RepID=A0A1X7MQU3_9LACT|nr:DNA polymerase III subunit gamma/tau [Carnobacterium iners]SEL01215.1 DNA polymerase III, tau subunit [Carnobacterium iners]SMH27190.1 DNA polymerase III, tau subunit [Carnobacterium iners]
MSYQALYRVWRPQKFQDVAGQKAITQTLRNALIQQKTSHAYLFTGPRGTGKTSGAKIFAKAINCHYLKDGEPCNECETCRAITKGQLNDVIEIDAASNNGVEEIRDIRDKAKYAPTSADYKIYIIDEVHMLSTGAFNALLKTLEEPPKNVVFILATTEPHKIPLTIISRTQRFDFKRINVRDISDRMRYILTQEKIEFEEAALPIVARAAEGGMRDALSILDQAISFGDDTVTIEDVMSVTGSLTQELMLTYFEAVVTHDTKKGLFLLQEILADGKDAARFVEDLILFSRDLLVYQQAPQMSELLDGAKVDAAFKKLSETISADSLYQMIVILNGTQTELRFTNHPDVYLEVATVRLTHLDAITHLSESATSNEQVLDQKETSVPSDNKKIIELENELLKIKKQMESILVSGHSKVATKKTKSVSKKAANNQFKPNTSAIYSILKEATRENLAQLKNVWPDLLNMLSVTQRAMLKASTPVAAGPSGLIVSFDYDILCQKATNDSELMEAVKQFLERLIGNAPQMIFVPGEQWPIIREQYVKQLKNRSSDDKAVENTHVGQVSKPDQSKEQKGKSFEPVKKQLETVVDTSEWDSLEDFVPPAQEDDKVVTEAMALFGEKMVEVKND